MMTHAPPAAQPARPGWLSETLFPFESRHIEINGHHIHYIDEGKGPVLLFLHGNPAWSFLFRKVIPLLRGQFRCVSLDYPGFGLSIPAAGYDFLPESHSHVVEAFIAQMGIQKLTPVVSDWGGPIGLNLAVNRPELIQSLIIGNTFAWPVDDDFHFIWFSHFFGGHLGKFLIRRFNMFVNSLIPLGIRKAKLSTAEMAAYRNPFPDADSRLPTHIFPREIIGSTNFLRALSGRLFLLTDKEVLFLWAGKDIAFREKELRRFEDIFARHETVKLPAAGHFLWEDEPEQIAERIADFMRLRGLK